MSRLRDERGSIVEAAFATPIFFLLIFSLLEFGIYMKDQLTVSNMARSGARVASATGQDSNADYMILRAVMRGSAGIDPKNIEAISIFREDPDNLGHPHQNICGYADSFACNHYTLADTQRPEGDFGCIHASLDASWCPKPHNGGLGRGDSLSSNPGRTGGPGPDSIGVYVRYRYRSISGLISDRAIQQSVFFEIEPRTE